MMTTSYVSLMESSPGQPRWWKARAPYRRRRSGQPGGRLGFAHAPNQPHVRQLLLIAFAVGPFRFDEAVLGVEAARPRIGLKGPKLNFIERRFSARQER